MFDFDDVVMTGVDGERSRSSLEESRLNDASTGGAIGFTFGAV